MKAKISPCNSIMRRKKMIEEEKNNRSKTIYFKVIETLEEPAYMEIPENIKEEDYESYINAHMQDAEISYGWDEVISTEYKPNSWSYVKKTDTDFRESADTANSTKDFLRFLP